MTPSAAQFLPPACRRGPNGNGVIYSFVNGELEVAVGCVLGPSAGVVASLITSFDSLKDLHEVESEDSIHAAQEVEVLVPLQMLVGQLGVLPAGINLVNMRYYTSYLIPTHPIFHVWFTPIPCAADDWLNCAWICELGFKRDHIAGDSHRTLLQPGLPDYYHLAANRFLLGWHGVEPTILNAHKPLCCLVPVWKQSVYEYTRATILQRHAHETLLEIVKNALYGQYQLLFIADRPLATFLTFQQTITMAFGQHQRLSVAGFPAIRRLLAGSSRSDTLQQVDIVSSLHKAKYATAALFLLVEAAEVRDVLSELTDEHPAVCAAQTQALPAVGDDVTSVSDLGRPSRQILAELLAAWAGRRVMVVDFQQAGRLGAMRSYQKFPEINVIEVIHEKGFPSQLEEGVELRLLSPNEPVAEVNYSGFADSAQLEVKGMTADTALIMSKANRTSYAPVTKQQLMNFVAGTPEDPAADAPQKMSFFHFLETAEFLQHQAAKAAESPIG